MTRFDDNWQTKCFTISERTKFIFNNELLSDVKFVVPVSSSESESWNMIPAHKFVLAISSPVFYAMFYGQVAETTDPVELPDCEYESLLELFRYLYSDNVNLTGSNVMSVLNLAKKYMVPSLADKCTEYLLDNLEPSNVFAILTHAQRFEEKKLKDRCWKVVEMQTGKALTSNEFITIEKLLVQSVVKKEELNVKEVELLKAVNRWATKECERQGLSPDGNVKRRILGEDIVKAIRFPLMSRKEFVSVVSVCMILTVEENDAITKYFNGSLKCSLPFEQTPRSVQLCHRFAKLHPPEGGCWRYSDRLHDCLNLTVNKSVRLHGVQHFGRQGGIYAVSIEIKDATSGSSLVKQSGSYSSEEYKIHDYYGYFGFDVMFNHPVNLEGDKTYKIVSLIEGLDSWYGEEGEASVEFRGVRFTFSDSGASSNETNGTTETRGQFPFLLFSSSCFSS